MTPNNKKLLLVGAAIFVVVLFFRIIPAYSAKYSDLQRQRTSLRQSIEDYEMLVEDEARLAKRAAEMREGVMGIEDRIFKTEGNLLASQVQGIVRDISGRTNVDIREMRVGKVESFEDWHKLTQELTFTTSQSRILPFLNALKAHEPRIYVSRMTITRQRSQYQGSMTIEAFSRPEE
jgi:hypothetical protein